MIILFIYLALSFSFITSTHVDCWEFERGAFATEVLAIWHRQWADVCIVVGFVFAEWCTRKWLRFLKL